MAMLRADTSLSMMRQLVEAMPGMADALQNDVMMSTFFFPTNDAFEEIMDSADFSIEELMNDKRSLQMMLMYHVLDSEVRYSETMTEAEEMVAYNGHNLTVSGSGSNLAVLDDMGRVATLVQRDVPCGRSAVHVIDRVLVPMFTTIFQLLKHNPLGQFGTTLAALRLSHLSKRYNNASLPLVMLAPTEEAWRKLSIAMGQTLEHLLADPVLLDTIFNQTTLLGSLSDFDEGKTSSMTLPSFLDTPMYLHLDANSHQLLASLVPRDAWEEMTASEWRAAEHAGTAAGVMTERMVGLGPWQVYGVDSVLLDLDVYTETMQAAREKAQQIAEQEAAKEEATKALDMLAAAIKEKGSEEEQAAAGPAEQ